MLEPRHDDPIARLVRDLPEESPSMAWRASLNEELRQQGARRVRGRRLGFGSLGLGLVTASFAALMVLPAMTSVPGVARPVLATHHSISPKPTVAANDLLALDGEGTALTEVSGAGLSARESDLTEGEIRDVLVSQML